ncbi:MAG: HD domain-containing protein, partial [Clostridia bacterium]|nr:HD domain-containing protein [Clostridia bacterium]
SIFDNEEDIYICFVIGLLHDIARFEQWTLFSSYRDTKEYSHPEKSAEILFDRNVIKQYPIDKKYYDIIKFAIANHGALKIDESQKDERILKFTKMIRDADKLDILRQSMNQGQPSFSNEFSSDKISDKVLETFYKKQCVNKADCNSVADRAIMQTAMSFDLNYDISKKIYLDNNFYMASYINYKDVLSKENAQKLHELALFMKETFEESCSDKEENVK